MATGNQLAGIIEGLTKIHDEFSQGGVTQEAFGGHVLNMIDGTRKALASVKGHVDMQTATNGSVMEELAKTKQALTNAEGVHAALRSEISGRRTMGAVVRERLYPGPTPAPRGRYGQGARRVRRG